MTLWRSLPAAALALVLALALAGSIVGRAVDEEVLEPQMYVDALAGTGAFDSLTNRFVPAAAVARVEQTWPEAPEEVLAEVSAWARAIFDPPWFEARALQVWGAITAYLSGDTDRIGVTVPVADRLNTVVAVLRERLQRSPLTTIAYDRMTELVAGEISALRRLPFGGTVQRDTWLKAVRLAASEPWLASVLSQQTQEVVDFLTGADPDLDVTVPLAERRAAVADAVRLVIENSDVPDYLTRRLVDEYLTEELRDVVLVPEAGITLTRRELLETLANILESEWVRDRRQDVVRVVAEYLAGTRPTLALEFDLDDLKTLVTARVSERVKDKLVGYLDQAPPCTRDQTARVLLGTLDPLSCQPTGAPRKAMLLLLDGFIRTAVREALDEHVPDRWRRSEAELRAEVSAEAWALIETGRRWMIQGIHIDEPTVRQLLGEYAWVLDRVLEVTRGGWTVTVQDLPLGELGWSWSQLQREVQPYREAAARLREAQIGLLLTAGFSSALLMLLSWLPLHLRLLWLGAGAALGGLIVVGLAHQLDEWVAPMVDQALARASPQIPQTISAALAWVTPAFLDRLLADVTGALRQPAWILVGAAVLTVLSVTVYRLRRPDPPMA